MSHITKLFKHNCILKFDDLLISRNILFLYNLIHENYNIDFKSYFIFNNDKVKFILQLMRTTQFQILYF